MNRDSVDPPTSALPEEPAQLTHAPDRMHAPYGDVREWLQQPPVASADGEAPRAEVRLQGLQHESGEAEPPTLQVQHELRLLRRCREQLVQQETGPPGGGDRPAIPEDRERPDGLQMADLEPAAKETDVGLSERVGALDGVESGQPVARTVRYDERAVPAAVTQDGPLTHSRRV